MCSAYGPTVWAPAEIFVWGGGSSKTTPIRPKNAPHIEKKVEKRPPDGEKGPHTKKNVAKRPPPYGEKIAKKAPHIAKKNSRFSKGRPPILAAPPLPAGAHGLLSCKLVPLTMYLKLQLRNITLDDLSKH